MIKGVYKNVVLIRDAQSELFEQAIFILKPHVPAQSGDDRKQILEEAQQVLESYAMRQGVTPYELHEKKHPMAVALLKQKRSLLWYGVAAAAVLGLAAWGLSMVL